MSADDRWLDICTLLSELQNNQIISDVKLNLTYQVKTARFVVMRGKITKFKKSEEYRELTRLSDSLEISNDGNVICVTITVDVTQGFMTAPAAIGRSKTSQESRGKTGEMRNFLGVRPLAFMASLWYNIFQKGRCCRKGGAI